MRRLIFAAFFATAIVFPGSTYSSEKELKVPNSDCLIAHRLGKAPNFCDEKKSGCCCTMWNELEIPESEMRKLSNGVCCTAGCCTPSAEVKVCSGDRDRHRSMQDGHTATFIWVCEQK